MAKQGRLLSRVAKALPILGLVAGSILGGCSSGREARLSSSSPSPSASTSPSAKLSLGNPAGLSVADVRRFYRDFARLSQPGDNLSGAQYSKFFRALVLRNVDFRTYAADEAADTWLPVHRALKGKQIAEALHDYDAVAAKRGPRAAYDWVIYAWSRLEQPHPTREDELMNTFAPDLGLLAFMTEPPAPTGEPARPEWAWRLMSIAVEGRDTARMTFTARSLPNEDGWSFRDPSRLYVKVWRFRFDPAVRRWRLAAWPNRTEFIASVRSNLVDPNDSLLLQSQPFWWMIP